MTGDDDTPHFLRDPLSEAGALFHLRGNFAGSYGATDGYDFASPSSLIAYTVEFVNRPIPKITSEEMAAGGARRPVGRNGLSDLLHAAVHGGGEIDLEKPSDDALAKLRQRAKQIHWISRLERTPTGAEWHHHAMIGNADSYYALIATLLMSESHRRLLGQCKYCDIFFMVRARGQHEGREERLYCSKEHRELAHAEGGAVRQKARRARQRAEKELIESGLPRVATRSAVKQASKDCPTATADELARNAKALVLTARKAK